MCVTSENKDTGTESTGVPHELAAHEVMNFHVARYMFCHPENVVLRKGQRKILHWQDSMASSALYFSVKCKSTNGTVESMKLYYDTKVLESLEPLASLHSSSRLLQVTTADRWLGFKWTTKRGNTQFQIRLESSEECEQLLHAVERSGVPVLRQSQQCEREPFYESQQTQVAEDETMLTQDLFVSQDFSQQHFSQQLRSPQEARCAQQLPKSPDATQVECEPAWERPEQSAVQRQATYQGLSSDWETPTTPSCLMHAPSASSAPSSEISPASAANIALLVQDKKQLHFPVEAYSFATVRRPQDRLRWNHVGLVSDLCLSLISGDQKGEPAVRLSRGLLTLEALALAPGELRGYFTNGILILQQRKKSSRHLDRYVQLQMMPQYVATTCEWLAYWQISIEDPLLPAELRTEATTTDVDFGRASGSEMSLRSRESRFWFRRAQRFAN